MSDSEQRSPSWIDSEHLDYQISEACQLYGIDQLECTRDFTKKESSDADDSIISDDSDKDEVTLQDRVNSQLYIIRETDSGQTLWKCSIKESDAIADHIAAGNKLSYRLPCHSFRSMLPPFVEGERHPILSPSWLRYCRGGVLFGALQIYSENRLSGYDNSTNRLRFPEHVYCWFADDKDQASSNEDRWAFYHGLKLSSTSNSECWLIQNLLDDMQGEDFFSFLAHSIANIKKQSGKYWDLQFGEVFSCRKAMANKLQLVDTIQQQGVCFEDDESCAANIWIPIEICKEIIHQLFYSDWIKSSEYVEELFSNLNQLAVDIANAFLSKEQEAEAPSQDEPDAVTASVDLFTFLQIIMKTYLSHRKKNRVHIRLMFETASTGVLTDSYDLQKTSSSSCPSDQKSLVSVPQLYQILQTIWQSITLEETTMIYRDAYDTLYPPSQWNKTAPDGINYQSFLAAAERHSLFSRVQSK